MTANTTFGRLHRRIQRFRLPRRRLLSLVLLCCAVRTALVYRKGKHQQNGSLLWMTPRTGGFNNQLITVYEAIRCAQIQKRKVVLPLIYENVRADTSSKGLGPYPFEDYFDIEALGTAAVSVTTPRQLDEASLPCLTIYYTTSPHFKANERRIPRLLKQQYVKRYHVNLTFVDSLESSKGRTCVDDSFCSFPKEFGVYSNYNQSGQGYNIRRSPTLKRIREAFRPSSTVQALAENVLIGIGEQFNAMHLRRGDFDTKCVELPKVCEQYGNNSFLQSPDWIMAKVSQFRNPQLPLFLSTTHPDECREMLKVSGLRLLFMDDYNVSKPLTWALERTDLISFASQVVAAQAEEFVGNRFSSYTTEINNLRYLRNPKDRLSFF